MIYFLEPWYLCQEYSNLHDRDTCLVWVPEQSSFTEEQQQLVTDAKRHLKLGDIVGLPIGHVPRGLCKCLSWYSWYPFYCSRTCSPKLSTLACCPRTRRWGTCPLWLHHILSRPKHGSKFNHSCSEQYAKEGSNQCRMIIQTFLWEICISLNLSIMYISNFHWIDHIEPEAKWMTFSHAFSWNLKSLKFVVFWIKFPWHLLPMI